MLTRTSSYPVLPLILNRWSPRALSGESLSKHELMTLFEAARWAPSSYNNQPWRFIYAHRGSGATWETFLNLLVPANRSWAERASVLVVVASSTKFSYNNKPARTHSFDTGAAWENLALQASSMGIIAHGMEGFSYERAAQDLNIPDDFTVEAMIALGKPGHKNQLTEEQQKAEQPSSRLPLEKLVFERTFKQ